LKIILINRTIHNQEIKKDLAEFIYEEQA